MCKLYFFLINTAVVRAPKGRWPARSFSVYSPYGAVEAKHFFNYRVLFKDRAENPGYATGCRLPFHHIYMWTRRERFVRRSWRLLRKVNARASRRMSPRRIRICRGIKTIVTIIITRLRRNGRKTRKENHNLTVMYYYRDARAAYIKTAAPRTGQH